MTKIAILGGHLVDPKLNTNTLSNVYIADKKIVAITNDVKEDFHPDVTIDAQQRIICPGIVDLNAHVLQPGFKTNLTLAAAAGITSLCAPAFSNERNLHLNEIEQLLRVAHQYKSVHVYFLGALTQHLKGEQLNELHFLKEVGCIGLSNGIIPILDTQIKRRCYDYAAMLGMKIFIYPQDGYLVQKGFMHEGEVSTRLGLRAIPTLAETLGLSQEIQLIEETGVAAHFCRISAAKSTDLLQEAKKQNPDITSDTAIYQLFLTDVDVSNYNSFCHVYPPLRSETDRQALCLAIAKGLIDSLTSDHAYVPSFAKKLPFQMSASGIASWPTLLPLTLRLVNENGMTLPEAIATITLKPAKILGIDAGYLKEGGLADIFIFDPHEEWYLSDEELHQFGSNTPFKNWPLQGRVKYTLVEGRVVYQHDSHTSNGP